VSLQSAVRRASALAVALILASPVGCDGGSPGTAPMDDVHGSGDATPGADTHQGDAGQDVQEPPGPDLQLEVVASSLQRNEAPAATDAELAELVEGNTGLALALYGWLRADKPDDNLFFSPHSLSVALAMTFAGARGITADQMAETLRFTLEGDALHDAFNKLALELASREDVEVPEGEPFALRVVNAIWGLKGYPYLDAFLDTLAVHYGAAMHAVDFINATEEARQTINAWVADATAGLIEELIPEGVITEYTRLVLTNAIYFHAGWKLPFSKDLTAEAPFHLLGGSTSSVQMMRLTGALPYAEVGGHQAVELPYVGGEVSMVVLLPADGAFGDFEDQLDAASLGALLGALALEEGTLRMPRLEITSEFSAKEALTDLGMPVAFDSGADFTGITELQNLHIQDVIHQGVVKVDEEGTEAAAATAVIVGTDSEPTFMFDVTLDRPFLFVIRDRPTGAIIFMGRVLDP